MEPWPKSHISPFANFTSNFCNCAKIRFGLFKRPTNPNSTMWMRLGGRGPALGHDTWGWGLARHGVAGESVHCELCSGARGAEKVIAVIFIVTRFNNKDEWPEIKASEDVWSPKQYATLLLSKLFEETGNRMLELFPLILLCCHQISRMFDDTKWYLLASLSANYSVTSITSCHHAGR